MGGGLQELLSERLPSNIDLKVNFIPNGKLKHVMANISSKIEFMSQGDVVIIMGGTNDFEVQSPYRLTLHQAFQTLPPEWKARIVFMPIPERYDINVAKKREDANGLLGRLVQLVVNRERGDIVLHDFKGKLNMRLYTSHGLHLNSEGKIELCNLFKDIILGSEHSAYKRVRLAVSDEKDEINC